MLTTGLFTTRVFPIVIQSTREPIRIIPFGDVHYGAPGFSEHHWREFLNYAKRVRNAYFLGMGDYCDFASTSERQALKGISLHDATRELLEQVAHKQLLEFKKQIAFMGDRLIGIIGGNHTFDFADGQTFDERLASLLGVPYLGVSSLIRLAIDYQSCRCSVDIFAHHGRGGGGTTEGNSVNQVARLRGFMQADIYIQGHDHDRWCKPGRPNLVPYMHLKSGQLEVRERPTLLARSGSFLRAWEPGTRSYIVDAAKGPCQLGTVEIQLWPSRTKERGFALQIKGVA